MYFNFSFNGEFIARKLKEIGFSDIKVEYYGALSPLNQVATLTVPESRLILIQPWDVSVIGEIEKAISKSDLGLSPSNDGKIIRIAIPALTEERRKELVKVVKKYGEDGKVSVRHVRRESMDEIKKLEKEKAHSEDEIEKLSEQIQKCTDDYVHKIDELMAKKEKDLMHV